MDKIKYKVNKNGRVRYRGEILENDADLMLCTGLKDKNGKDIYLYDKFAGDEGNGDYYLVGWNKLEARFEVWYYNYPISYGEGGQEIEGNEIDLVDTNVFEMSCLTDMEIL